MPGIYAMQRAKWGLVCRGSGRSAMRSSLSDESLCLDVAFSQSGYVPVQAGVSLIPTCFRNSFLTQAKSLSTFCLIVDPFSGLKRGKPLSPEQLTSLMANESEKVRET